MKTFKNMENYFSDVMSKNSDKELQEIIANRNSYEPEAYIAAIEELQKRNLAPEELVKIKEELIERRTEDERKSQIDIEEKKVERKKAFIETVELLKPSKDYFYTPIIVYLNILIFIIMVLSGVHPFEPSVESLIQWGGNVRSITLNGEVWRLFTNVFLHGGLFHLLLNMYALLYIGGLLEKKFGNHRFLLVYIIAGILASIASISFNENIVSIGASGAIFGLYGLFLALLISKNYSIPVESRQNLLSSILLFIGYNLVFGFTKGGIDNAAHIGGLISGFAIGFSYSVALREPNYSKFISSGLLVLTIVIVLLMPKLISNPAGAFQNMIAEFANNEKRALWMYKEDLPDSPEKKQQYFDRLQTEGIELWDSNLKLLGSLSDLPPYLKERVDILTEYCKLRKESCRILQSIVKKNRDSDQVILKDINLRIDSTVTRLEKLNK